MKSLSGWAPVLFMAIACAPTAIARAPDCSDVAPRPAENPDAPVVLKRCAPVFPEEAVRDGSEGAVRLRAVVNEDGAVTALLTLWEVPAGSGFAEAAREAMQHYRFVPRPGKGDANFDSTIDFSQYTLQVEAPFLAAQYPPSALQARVNGAVLVQLTFDAAGTLSGAKVISERPAGYGFAAAAEAAIRAGRFPLHRQGQYAATYFFWIDENNRARSSLGRPKMPSAGEPPPADQNGSQTCTEPRPAKRQMAEFPLALAKGGTRSGVVVAKVDVDAMGNPSNARLISEDPVDAAMGQPVVQALGRFLFHPGCPGTFTWTYRWKVNP